MKYYYSALDKIDTSVQYPALDKFKVGNSIAFYHDIEKGISMHYKDVDILYSEPPWVDGYLITQKRAKTSKKDYLRFMIGISRAIKLLRKPTIMVMGISHKKYLPETKTIIPVDLNGYKARAFVYNMKIDGLDFMDIDSLIKSLAKKYNRVGDFCCGYGNTGRIFYEAGKEFVMSDINRRCIGFIQKYYENILR